MSHFTIKLFSILFSFVLLAGCSPGNLMLNEQQSPYSFDQTVDRIVTNAREQGWVVPKIYDFQKSLAKHKQADPGRIKVLKICQPKYAARMLRGDESKFVSAMMPCSISVYEKSDGRTYVSSVNMSLMARMFGGDIGETLENVAADDEAILSFMD